MIIPDKLLFLIAGLAAEKPPGDQDVVRELQRLLGSDPFFKKPKPLKLNLDWLDSWLKGLAKVLQYPLLIVLGLAVLVGLVFLIRSFVPYMQGKSAQTRPEGGPVPQSGKTPPPNRFLLLYQRALEESGAGQYRPAMISLHKATVEYLLTRVIIMAPSKKYTNNDLKRKLAGNALYQPFCTITNLAEIAGFSTMEVTQAHFNRALEAFESAFL